MIKIGDHVEILEGHCSGLAVGSQHIVTAIERWKEHTRRVVSIDGWLFPTSSLKKVTNGTLSTQKEE